MRRSYTGVLGQTDGFSQYSNLFSEAPNSHGGTLCVFDQIGSELWSRPKPKGKESGLEIKENGQKWAHLLVKQLNHRFKLVWHFVNFGPILTIHISKFSEDQAG